ncbi:sperm flagellar 2 isoform X4 [Pelobates cultripes]|uniref:Sperm flagellar 2 isoform X4 n=1 Tax=Pelobates cultripes TaxID=61616 RepID=A0AAD1W722_PELCU|nr:sperm flagellar 2 isoform X4 [Pelobates cultripes]
MSAHVFLSLERVTKIRDKAIQRQAKLDCEEQVRKVQELHDMIAAERAEARYKKHYLICQEVTDKIVDLATKTGEYRELTNRLIPAKLMREWKELFFTGYSLYEEASVDPLPSEPTPEQLLELEKEGILDEKDYDEYKTMSGEWVPPNDLGLKAPAPNNNILGHVVGRLLEIVHPPEAPTPPPVFPQFPIKGCVLGKLYSGKSTCLKRLAQAYSIQVLNVDDLVNEAIQAYHDKEMENVTVLSEPLAVEEATADKEATLKDSSSYIPNKPKESADESITKKEDPPENEISPCHIVTSSKDKHAIQKFSERAQLGEMLDKQLRKGKSASDDLLTKIIINAINRIPENTGWIMDGFPATIDQAKLFEKALTGDDIEKAKEKNKKDKSLSLVKIPSGRNDAPPHSPALDCAVLIDISDTVVLQRAAEQLGAIEQPGSQESNSPNADHPTGQDQTQPRDQIQHRIVGFLDNWEKLEMWFSAQQNILIKVNGEVGEDALCKKIEEVFLTAIFNKKNKDTEAENKKEVSPPAPVIPPPPAETSVDDQPPLVPKQETAKKEKEKGSKSPKGSARRKDKSIEKKEKKADTGKELGQKSAKSGSARGRSPGKKSLTAPATPEPPEPIPAGPPPIQPGSAEWVYVDEPLPQEIPEILVPYWENIENTYGLTIKTALRSMRKERLIIINYFYDSRNRFRDYLKRPDHKQEFVSQWQSDFSSVADDLRGDEETKAELHQRVDDLRDRLWDICDNRKEEAEQERHDIMNEEWLPDHMGILVNHLFSIMQAEVDRFQDTVRLLRDYYQGMERKIPSESTPEFTRIPLIDIFSSDLDGESEKPTRIPLVSRRPQSPEQSPGKQKSKTSLTKGKEDQIVEISKQILETDEKLIVETWQTALTAIADMVTREKQMKEAEEEKERQAMEAKEKERLKASQPTSRDSGKGSKKKPPKSPKGKPGGKSPGPVEPAPSLQTSEEKAELQKRQELKLKSKQEYFFALECEESAVKTKLDLIKSKALDVCQDLISKAEHAYKDMDMWLGARFLAEMSSIEKLIQVARHYIETSTKIPNELVLEQADFYISCDVKVIPDPPPPLRPLPVEMSINGTLTILQLNNMYEQCMLVAPEGLMSNKLFTEILMDLTSMNIGNDVLPDLWMNLSVSEIQEITSALSLNSDVVNWRTFLLSASLPWPYPSSSQLLDTLHKFQNIDEGRSGSINEESYNQVELWFTAKTEEHIPENPTEPLPFNRLEHLIKFFFKLFANRKRDPALLDYTEMLLYFACHPDPKDGFYRALSVATGKPLLKKPEDNVLLKSVPTMDSIQESRNITKNEIELAETTEEVTITLQEVLRVLQHGAIKDGDNHRFGPLNNQTNDYSKNIEHIFRELNPENLDPVTDTSLMKHRGFQDLVENCQLFKLPDIHGILHKLRHMQQIERKGSASSPR